MAMRTNLIFSNYPSFDFNQFREEILTTEIIKPIEKQLGLTFVSEKEIEINVCFANSSELRNAYKTTFTARNMIDYSYAVLHRKLYNEKYKKFLTTDFPRIHYPKNQETFWQVIKLGKELRQIHLLEAQPTKNYMISYPIAGSNCITTKIINKDWEIITPTSKGRKEIGRVWINGEQYFDNLPLLVWEFTIGGNQPAQNWLKERKGSTLSMDDILHYQKIIEALFETDRVMHELATIEID